MENENKQCTTQKEKGKSKLFNAFFPKEIKCPLIFIVVAVVVVMAIAMLLENTSWLDGKNLSGYFRAQFEKRNSANPDGKSTSSFGYFAYYLVLYLGVIAYVVSSLLICAKKDTKEWCALNIAIGVIFMVAADAWLTITLQYNSGTLYNEHLLCYISIATVISGISAAKMKDIMKREREEEKAGREKEETE